MSSQQTSSDTIRFTVTPKLSEVGFSEESVARIEQALREAVDKELQSQPSPEKVKVSITITIEF